MTLNKKKVRKILIGSILIGALTFATAIDVFGITGEPCSKTFKGIEYRLSDTSSTSKEVSMEGTLWNPLLGKSRFQGIITYDNKAYEGNFSFKQGDGAFVMDESNYTGANSSLGILHTDETLSSITLLIFEYDDAYIQGWEAENGLIFSGDAETREEAELVTDRNM